MTKLTPKSLIENRIQELRGLKELTQAELADQIGVTRATINALERGDYNPSLELAFRLANLFELSIEEIFYLKKGKRHE